MPPPPPRRRPPRRGLLWLCLAVALAVLGGVSAYALASGDGSAPADFGAAPADSAPGRTAPTGGPATTAPDTPASAPESPAPAPRRLTLPRVGVEAPVVPVGVAKDGEAEVPKDAREVGWYRFGPAPGAKAGSAVIVGHVDSQTQGLGVLAKLREVREGDRVQVRAVDGSTRDYRITTRRTVAKQSLDDLRPFRRDGSPVLTLITCTGPYLKEKGGYQENLVVTAVPEAR
ncbi:sortase domain-bontaining protein [Streptomyces sp. NPDC060194]|uniref:class F sortase n=1 Tax=Streptomyces sp. NPDC060194 TaxID=3347069 RepID=UPI003647164A